jgi:hypothetical protein
MSDERTDEARQRAEAEQQARAMNEAIRKRRGWRRDPRAILRRPQPKEGE